MSTATISPRYVMNTETGVIYAYSEALLKMDSPKFVEYRGELPPFDLSTGQRTVKKQEAVAVENVAEAPTEDERVERIAAILPLVPKEDLNDKGVPGLLAVEKLSMLKDVKRSEVKAAMRLRLEIVNARDNAVKLAADESAQEETDG